MINFFKKISHHITIFLLTVAIFVGCSLQKTEKINLKEAKHSLKTQIEWSKKDKRKTKSRKKIGRTTRDLLLEDTYADLSVRKKTRDNGMLKLIEYDSKYKLKLKAKRWKNSHIDRIKALFNKNDE